MANEYPLIIKYDVEVTVRVDSEINPNHIKKKIEKAFNVIGEEKDIELLGTVVWGFHVREDKPLKEKEDVSLDN